MIETLAQFTVNRLIILGSKFLKINSLTASPDGDLGVNKQ